MIDVTAVTTESGTEVRGTFIVNVRELISEQQKSVYGSIDIVKEAKEQIRMRVLDIVEKEYKKDKELLNG
jgi:hypothetical protein